MCGIIATLISAQTTPLTYSQKPKYDHGTTLDGRLGEGVGVVRVERHLLVLRYMYFVSGFARPRQDKMCFCFDLLEIYFLSGKPRKDQTG